MGFANSGRNTKLHPAALALLSLVVGARPGDAEAGKTAPPTVIGVIEQRHAVPMSGSPRISPRFSKTRRPVCASCRRRRGSVQNITDLLYLKGVDLAIVQSDVLAYITEPAAAWRRRRAGQPTSPASTTRSFTSLRAIGFASVADLSGKQVNFGPEGSGTF